FSMLYFDIFGKRAPMGKTSLLLKFTHLLIVIPAVVTAAAGLDKRSSHPLTGFPSPDFRSQLHDDACKLMTRHMRQTDVRIVSHPTMPVAPANPGCHNLQQNRLRS